MPEQFSILDPRQLERIESVHRGFLYQHIYATGCLLLASKSGVVKVMVERDEDIELVLQGLHIYVQVKTRSRPLMPSDIQDIIQRFTNIREAHADGSRARKASFWIVSNIAPGPKLMAEMEGEDWPDDVVLRWPGHDGHIQLALPPAWVDTSKGVVWCADLAAVLSFSALAPATLVWKLAGCVMLASSGGAPYINHVFSMEDLPRLFEQIVVQLQDFPATPARYRPQAKEPNLVSNKRIRVITGFSGAGKTAWSSQAALHVPDTAAYFDVGDVPSPAATASLVRELAGQLLVSRKGGLGEILLPGASGIEMLRLLDQRLHLEGVDAVVVIDNAHRISPEDLSQIIGATNRLRFVLLCQPNPEVHSLLTTLGIDEEQLSGWSADTVAAEVADSGCRADYATIQRLLEITAGLPLYVQSCVQIASAQYNGEVSSLCNNIEEQTHIVATAQETILARRYDVLPQEMRDTVAILSIAGCPLTKDEAALLVKHAIGIPKTNFSRIIRTLIPSGFVQLYGNEHLKVHNSLRLLGNSRLQELGEEVLREAHIALKDILKDALICKMDISRFALYVRMLGLTGDTKTLVDLASEEMFHEIGLTPDFKVVLNDVSQSEDLPPDQRFWALDAVTFAELKVGDISKLSERLETMEKLIDMYNLGRTEQMAHGMKQMLFAAKRGDESEMRSMLRKQADIVPNNPSYLRILKYNTACSLHMIDKHEPAEEFSLELIMEYYDHLGIDIVDIFAKNPEDIWPLLTKTDTLVDDLKHLADSLDLHARCLSACGEDSGHSRIHAFKFYTMASAFDSAIKVGQDFVDEVLQRDDPIGARKFFEEALLPLVYQTKIMERVIPLRAQYAVTLAYCGDFKAAEEEMARLAPYESGLAEQGQQELQNQRLLITKIRDAYKGQDRSKIPSYKRSHPARKIGRNERCPCGSGMKYKRCCGIPSA